MEYRGGFQGESSCFLGDDLTMINYEKAKDAFEIYLDGYDRQDDKIKLKIVHTYCVVDCAQEIARRMNLCEEDVQLAKMIGLLHDIGRFEQVRQFDSFMPDTMDHAAYGVELLFGEKRMIRQFMDTDIYDEIIRLAIEKHSAFLLEGIEEERALLHARLIRDADKLDNCRVKLEETMETLLGVSEKEAGRGKISEKVWASCLAKESVFSADRLTKADFWVSYLAVYYDVNFPATFSIIKEQNYIRRIADRLQYEDPDTAEKVEKLVQEVEKFMDEKISIL